MRNKQLTDWVGVVILALITALYGSSFSPALARVASARVTETHHKEVQIEFCVG